MAAALTHAQSSVMRWGGETDDYLPIHKWFDETKAHIGDFRHRMLRHHTLGVEECIRRFGDTLTLSTGKTIPTRWVAEQHLIEDFGRIPSFHEWAAALQPEDWMVRGAQRLSEMV